MTPARHNDVSITTPDSDDVDALADMWVELAADQRGHGSHLLAAANRSRIRETFTRHVITDTVRVAVADSTLVGFVTFDVETETYAQDVTRGLIHNIYVRPSHRGRGIGDELLTVAETELVETGVDVVALQVLADNEAARRLYRRRGYTPHRLELEKSIETDTLTSDDP